MLQSNLIFNIQKQIKNGSKKKHEDLGVIEESTNIEETVEDSRVQLVLESSFIAGIHDKAAKAKTKEEFKQALITESFQMHKVEKKLQKDISYFTYLYENYVDDVFKEQYISLLESVLDDTIKLYRECDVTPRLVTPSLDSSELSEAQIVDIYKNRLNKTIKDDYTKPMLSGKITELYESEIRGITKRLIEEGSEINADHVRIYMPFEETLYQFNKSILVPEAAAIQVNAFMESITEEYLDFIEESAAEILQNIEKKTKLMTSMVSPNIFDAAVDAEGVEAPKMAGITIAIDKNFGPSNDEDCDICPHAAMQDSEAAEEMADEEEAEEIEAETGDIVGAEEDAREDIDVVANGEDYEDIPARDEDAEESAAEETLENPEQPGAIEIDTNDEVVTVDANGLNTNDSDVALQGDGNDNGEDDAIGAELPGAATAETEITPDNEDQTEIDSENLEDVSQEGEEDALEKSEEDISTEPTGEAVTNDDEIPADEPLDIEDVIDDDQDEDTPNADELIDSAENSDHEASETPEEEAREDEDEDEDKKEKIIK